MKSLVVFAVLAAAGILGLGSATAVRAEGNIDPNLKWAWSETCGWINLLPAGGGVTVHGTYLSGYAWGENIGWIKFGADGAGPYANSSAGSWGVNRAGNQLSGYAWSESTGWINFNPAGGGVTIDPSTGNFLGMAWGENIGWISFNGVNYGVKADIAPPNNPPTIAGTPPTVAAAGLMYTFTPAALDPEGDPLSFSIQNQPAWAAFDPATGTLSGAPTLADVGNSGAITISVTDGQPDGSADASLSFAITVDPSGNVIRTSGSTVGITDAWQTVALNEVFTSPIIIVSPPTYNERDPGVVRLRNVTGGGFEIRFQEWSYLDGSHARAEDISYLVLQNGRATLDDGTVVEAGAFSLGGTGVFQPLSFTAPFAALPALFLTVQSENEADAVAVRARGVTANGFEAALFEEEALMNGHAAETVGYLAVYSPAGSGTIEIGEEMLPFALQSVEGTARFTPVLSHSLRLEEARSSDPEIAHPAETVAVLGLGDRLFAQQVSSNNPDTTALRRVSPDFPQLLEWGTVDHVADGWVKVPLARRYVKPIVVAKPASVADTAPAVVRVRNVQADSFEVRVQEWSYLDGARTAGERIFYLVAEGGKRNLGGLTLLANKIETRSEVRLANWRGVTFATPFAEPPAVFTMVMTENDGEAVTSRVQNVTATGFEVALQEEEAKSDGHAFETLGWIAVSKGSARLKGRDIVVMDAQATHQWADILFGERCQRQFPVLVGEVETTFEPDPCTLRFRKLGPAGVSLLLQEEKSQDDEGRHTLEDLVLFLAE